MVDLIYSLINSLIYTAPAVLIALSMHEMAHGLASYGLGDPTPKSQGRLSINPLRHLDPWGTLMLLFFHFGWAKPVSVDPRYYENPKVDMAKVALAGPLMNFFIAFIALLIRGIMVKENVINGLGLIYLFELLEYIVIINIGLGVFNLIPIPPLDGSKVLMAILPERYYFSYMRFEQFGIFLLLLLISFGAFGGFLGDARYAIISGMEEIVIRLLGIS